MKVKIHICSNASCSINWFNEAKSVILLISNSRAIAYALTKAQAPVTTIIYSVAIVELVNKFCPHSKYSFQIIAS